MFKTAFLFGAVTLNTADPVSAPTSIQKGCCSIVELRQYSVHPGKRDAFIGMFEREFIESQEAVGNTVIGQFRDLDNPDHFIWLRGFPDMPARAQSLQAFYGGPVWKAHRDEANAHFVDTDNVLLLHAVREQSAFTLGAALRAPLGATQQPPGLVVATIYTLDAPADAALIELFERKARPVLRDEGIVVVAYYASETEANNFPRLPVREGEYVFIWFALYKDAADHAAHAQRLERSPAWRHGIAAELQRRSTALPQVLRLAPTPRSRLHG